MHGAVGDATDQLSVNSAGNVLVVLHTFNRTDANHCGWSVNDILANDSSYIVGSDRIDSHLKLCGWQTTSVTQHLTSYVFTDWRRSVKHQQHVGEQQVLGSVHFVFTGRMTESLPFSEHCIHSRVHSRAVGDQVDAPQTCVCVARVE